MTLLTCDAEATGQNHEAGHCRLNAPRPGLRKMAVCSSPDPQTSSKRSCHGAVGVYGVDSGAFGIEIKWSIDDLAACIGFQRSRFTKELRRLASFDFARLLICGSEQTILNYEYRGEERHSLIRSTSLSVITPFVRS